MVASGHQLFIVKSNDGKTVRLSAFEKLLEDVESLEVVIDGLPPAPTEQRRQWILSHVHELKGQDLECWCWPNRCHCETLARLAGMEDTI